MKKPANAGAHGLSNHVVLAVDVFGYASPQSALQVRRLVDRGLTPAVAAVTAALAYAVPEHWTARA